PQTPQPMGSSAGMGTRSNAGMSGMSEGTTLPPAGILPTPDTESWASPRGGHVPLGQIADVRIVSGAPMIRDEDGLLAGYVYVDMDSRARDIGGYVDDARRAVAREVRLPPGYFLRWTGQYELLEAMQQRMRLLIPLTLVIIVLLLYFTFRSWMQTLIVL